MIFLLLLLLYYRNIISYVKKIFITGGHYLVDGGLVAKYIRSLAHMLSSNAGCGIDWTAVHCKMILQSADLVHNAVRDRSLLCKA